MTDSFSHLICIYIYIYIYIYGFLLKVNCLWLKQRLQKKINVDFLEWGLNSREQVSSRTQLEFFFLELNPRSSRLLQARGHLFWEGIQYTHKTHTHAWSSNSQLRRDEPPKCGWLIYLNVSMQKYAYIYIYIYIYIYTHTHKYTHNSHSCRVVHLESSRRRDERHSASLGQ